MGTTPKYGLPYPELTDPPDGPAQIKALALAIETTLGPVIPTVQTGALTLVMNNAASATTTVTYSRAFSAAPSPVANIQSQSGVITGWMLRCVSVTTGGMSISMNGPSAVTYSPYINWTASLTAAAPAAMAQDYIEPGWHYVTATCHTAECPKNGEPVTGLLVPDNPEEWGWTGITCGACGQPITDIVPS